MRRRRGSARTWPWVCLLLLGLLGGCGSAGPEDGSPAASPSPTSVAGQSPDLQTAGLASAFPGSEALPGWTLTGEPEIYDRETLFNLVNGQAELYFAYGFEQAAVQSYEGPDAATIRLTIWQLATAQDAYGLFSAHTYGSTAATPVDSGNGGSIELGQRLVFWQDRYYVDLFVIPPQPDDQSLLALAEATSSRLPVGGEPPAVMAHLPADDLIAGSALFFHQEIAIQDWLWLGGENVLGLDAETDGVLARYDLQGAPAQLLLVQYPTQDAASAGWAALQDAGLEGLVTSGVREGLLASVWGKADSTSAQNLLDQTLDGQ